MKKQGPIFVTLILVLVFQVKSHVPDNDLSDEPFRMVEVKFQSGDIEFFATLFLPGGPEMKPGAVLIQGSGESSRKNLWSLQIGEGLALQGIAVLVPDKRGTGDSKGEWKTASFEDMALDIKSAIDFLIDRPEVDGRAVGVVGLSQGGFYAPIVAEKSSAVTFVAAVSSSALPFEETINHEMANTFSGQGLAGSAHEQAMAVQTAAIHYARDGDWSKYESSRTEALQGEAAEAAAGFPSAREHWLWSWIAKVVDFDPIPHWQRIRQPQFFAFGEADEEDNVPVAASISRINVELAPTHDVTVRVYPESGHALYDPVIAKEKGEGEVRADFIVDLANWIKNRSAKASKLKR